MFHCTYKPLYNKVLFFFFFMRIVQNLMTLKAEKSIDSFVTLCNNKRTDQVQRALGAGVGLTKP